jgi:hypothetical protein
MTSADTVAQDKTDKKVSVHINDEQFFVTSPVAAETLRQLGHIPEQNQLFLERPGKDPDTLVESGHSYEVKPGAHFYDLPRGTVGGR